MQPAYHGYTYYVPTQFLPHTIRHTRTPTEIAMACWDSFIRPRTHPYDCLDMLVEHRKDLSIDDWFLAEIEDIPPKEKSVDVEHGRRNIFAGVDTKNGCVRLIIINAAFRVIVFKLMEGDAWDYDIYASVTSYLKAVGRYPGFMTSRPCDLLREECGMIFVDEGRPVPVNDKGSYKKYIKRYPLQDALSRPDHCRPATCEVVLTPEDRTFGVGISEVIQTHPVICRDVSQNDVSVFQGFIGAIAQFMTIPELMILRNAVPITDDVFDAALQSAMKRDGIVHTYLRRDGNLSMFMRPPDCKRVIQVAGDVCLCIVDSGVVVVGQDVRTMLLPSELLDLLQELPIVYRKPKLLSIMREKDTGMYVHEYEKVIGVSPGGAVCIPNGHDLINLAF